MNTISARAAAVTGARHALVARNGQDAAAAWTGDDAAAVVVCDGCSAGASSEVGARLGAGLVVRGLATRLAAGVRPSDPALWTAVRAEVGAVLAELVARLPGESIHDCLLFTIVAAAARDDDAAVWVLGDGAFCVGGATRVLGPFDDNQPPYLGYDLLGAPRAAHFEVVGPGPIVIATDGVCELELARFATAKLASHPDALRRELAVLARRPERIDWDDRRVVRTPAVLQDDGAVGVIWR